MSFRTEVKAPKAPFSITHAHKLMSIGSCFSENIGKKFKEHKFSININPFGQQYNPASVAQGLERLITGAPYTEADLFYANELYNSFEHHGSFSRKDKAEALAHVNAEFQSASQAIREADVLFLTFGTAHVFELKETGRIVSNCHKLPAATFNFRLMEPDEIVSTLSASLQKLQTINNKLKLVFTVSPVRYFAFGHYENSVSKSHLFTAIYKLQQLHPGAYYFPAYEIVIDDLRDYRFYAEDMLHPNAQATQYVWERLCDTLLHKTDVGLLKEVEEIMSAARHRPRHPGSEAHRNFVKRTLEKIAVLESKHRLDFSTEKELLAKNI
jgi:hypothetical protein